MPANKNTNSIQYNRHRILNILWPVKEWKKWKIKEKGNEWKTNSSVFGWLVGWVWVWVCIDSKHYWHSRSLTRTIVRRFFGPNICALALLCLCVVPMTLPLPEIEPDSLQFSCLFSIRFFPSLFFHQNNSFGAPFRRHPLSTDHNSKLSTKPSISRAHSQMNQIPIRRKHNVYSRALIHSLVLFIPNSLVWPFLSNSSISYSLGQSSMLSTHTNTHLSYHTVYVYVCVIINSLAPFSIFSSRLMVPKHQPGIDLFVVGIYPFIVCLYKYYME